ncbi:MAG: metalloregulator ArsR/SmtB family transcription factor [Thermodesulfovibrionales bacterium]
MTKQKDLYELQADLCKVFASAIRIEIIQLLKDGERTVSDLVELLNTPKANVSQHLAIMRNKGILKNRREGVNIYYSIAHEKIIQACGLMREVLNDVIAERGKVANLLESDED